MDVRRILALSIVCASAPALAQDVIAGHSPEAAAMAAISAEEPGGAYIYDDQKVGENLTLERTGVVERVRFWGGSETALQNDLNTMGFRLQVYEQNGSGLTLLHDRRFGRGYANPAESASTFGTDDARMFAYEIDLASDPIELAGGQSYVVSVSAMHFVPPREGRESWSWASAGGDGAVFVDLYDGIGLAEGDVGVTGLAIELIGEMEAPACLADVNGDGALSPADFSAWVSAYNTQSPQADQNSDGMISPADFSAWVANYNAGC